MPRFSLFLACYCHRKRYCEVGPTQPMLLIVSSFVCKSSFRCLGASVSFCVGRYSHVLPGFCMSSTVCVCVVVLVCAFTDVTCR